MGKIKGPDFLLKRVYSDGSSDEPLLYQLSDIDTTWKMKRRGFLLTSAIGMAILSGCYFPSGLFSKKTADDVKAHISTIFSLSFSPDGRVLASGSADKTIKLWEMSSGILIKTMNSHTNSVNTLCFSPDGGILVSGSSDDTIKLWAMPSGKLITCLFDAAALKRGEKMNQYTMTNEYGQTITYTLPCGSPIPPGAICTCYCVTGTYNVEPSVGAGGTGGGYMYCSCDKVCVCIPIK